jgi:DNA/RNA-binding protein KIN17
MSESHMRQMKLVGQNADKHIKSFSRQFLNDFINILSHRYGTRRVFANGVYQEYIRDRNHLHMNSTVWHSLTEFCVFLGKEGICKVDETEKGWFIQWIDNSPEALAKRASMNLLMD